jgi:hypothetical protein
MKYEVMKTDFVYMFQKLNSLLYSIYLYSRNLSKPAQYI